MNRQRFIIFVLLVSLALAVAGFLISPLVAMGAEPPDSIVITLQTPPYQFATDSDGFDLVQIEGFDRFGAPGDPALPGKVYNIAVPPDVIWASLTVEIPRAETIELPGTYEIAPAPPSATWIDGQQIIDWGENAASIVDGKNTKVYQNDAYFPASYVISVAQSQMRKWRFARLLFTPVQYNPVTKKLRLATEVEVQITFERRQVELAQARVELNDTVMDDRAAQILHNYDQAQGWYQPDRVLRDTTTDADYVIITTNAIVTGSSKLSDFVLHKEAKGFAVEVVTEDDYGGLTGQPPDGTAERIRQWLINNYLTKHIEYVLLIGNPDPDDPSSNSDSVGDVPMKMCWPGNAEQDDGESPTDYFYADLSGNWDLDGDSYYGEYEDDGGIDGVDFAAEVYVGRIPVYRDVSGWGATLDSILQKIINYEDSPDHSWRKSALLPMSFSDSLTDGAYLAEHMKLGYLDSYRYTSYTMYQQMPDTDCDSFFNSDEPLLDRAVRNHWQNNPYGIVTWWAHGNQVGAYNYCGGGTLLDRYDTQYLADSHPAFVFHGSCSNGYPEDNNNFGYALLKQGAVGTVSASRVSFYTIGTWLPTSRPDNANIGYRFVEEIVRTSPAGKAFFDAKSALLTSEWFWWSNLMTFNLYGDPSPRIVGDANIGVSPTAFAETVPKGDTVTRTLTISNTGDVTLEFEISEIERQYCVAIYDHSTTGDISYWYGDNHNSWNVYQNILEPDPESRFDVTVITDLSPTTLAGFDRLILPDNAVPDVYLDDVSNWFTPGKRIIVVDSAICYAAYSGFMWPSSAGSNGYGTYWDYFSGSNDQEVIMIDKITEDYVIGDILSSQVHNAQMFSAELPPDALQLTAKQSDHSLIYVSSREVPDKGTIVILGPYERRVYSELHALVRDAVAGEGTTAGTTNVPWLSEDPATGTVPADGAQTIDIIFDAGVPEVTQPGEYYATLVIQSNDLDTPLFRVPVTMTVTPPATWSDVCVPHRIEITGVGMGDHHYTINPQTLSLADPASVYWLWAQVGGRYRESAPITPDSVTFTTDAPQSVTLTEPSSDTPHGYTFEANLQPTGQITASVSHPGDSYKTPRGLILYSKRATTGQWTSVGKTTDSYVYHDSHTEVLTFPPLEEATDLYVAAVVIDNDDDARPMVLEATAGGVTESVTELGPTDGDGLNVVNLTLQQVPTDTNQVSVTLHSPSEDGDSLVLVGLNVSYPCAGAVIHVVPSPATIPLGATDVLTITVTPGPAQVNGVQVHGRLDPTYLHLVDVRPTDVLTVQLDPVAFDPATGEFRYGAGLLTGVLTEPFPVLALEVQAVMTTTGTLIEFLDEFPPTDISGPDGSVMSQAQDGLVIVTPAPTLRGSVDMQGRPAKPAPPWAIPLTVWLTPAGSTLPYTYTTATDQYGEFGLYLEGITPGLYDVRVKGNHTLRNLAPNVSLVSGDNSYFFHTLLEGDVETVATFNQVLQADADVLIGSFNQCLGEPDFVANADLDESGCVLLPDFGLLSGNFGKEGDIVITPTTGLASGWLQASSSGALMAFSTEEMAVAVDEVVTLTLNIDPRGELVNGGMVHLSFDPALVEVVEVTLTDHLPLVLAEPLVDHQQGVVRFGAGVLGQTLSEKFSIATLSLKVKAATPGTTITLADVFPATDVSGPEGSVLAEARGVTLTTEGLVEKTFLPIIMKE